jgi:exopolysaccharide biosynthesis polyprenyl glycosylphosphotransferase
MHLMRAGHFIPELETGLKDRLTAATVRRWLWLQDLLILVACAGLAAALVQWHPIGGPTHEVREDVSAVFLVIVVWLVLLAVNGEYRFRRWSFGVEEEHRILTASLETFVLLWLTSYLTGFELPGRWVLLFFLTAVPSLMAGRALARTFIHHLRRAGVGRERAMLVGTPSAVSRVMTVLQRERWIGLTPVGMLETDDLGEENEAGVLTDIETVVDAVEALEADVVVLCDGAFHAGSDFNALARRLERDDVHLVVVPALTDIAPRRIALVPAAGMPLVFVEKPHAERALSRAKRVFDILVTGSALVVAAPIIAVVAVLIKVDDGGPILFRQTRIGRDGQPFDMLKIRSMVPDAERRLAEDHLCSDSSSVLFKMHDDPRVTRVGGFIRRYSIDELPQLWNVVRGDMSIVGPRPALASEVAQYEPTVLRRLDVRPGITGLWQVSGRSDLPWEDAVRLDLYYVDNWCMVQDAVILLRTARAVARPAGAY